MRDYFGQRTGKEKVRMTEQICGTENEGEEDDGITVDGKPVGAAVDSTTLKGKSFAVGVESEP